MRATTRATLAVASVRRLLLRSLIWLVLIAGAWSTPAIAEGADGGAMPEPARAEVVVGFYVNDIQAVKLADHSYVIDIYVWFRWRNPELDPSQSFEYMNMVDPEGHVRTPLYDVPQPQPDGSLYQVIRHQGAFSAKFPLMRYPFDSQKLRVEIEDTILAAENLRYVSDVPPVALNDEINLPGHVITDYRAIIRDRAYETAFGDLANPDANEYSRVSLEITVRRPWLTGAIKIFMPVLLIIFCAGLALLLDPEHIDARVGLAITALLTLVALQFTVSSTLPDVGYLMLVDQVYLASYLYILLVVGMVVRETRLDGRGDIRRINAGPPGAEAGRVARRGPVAAFGLTVGYAVGVALIFAFNLLA